MTRKEHHLEVDASPSPTHTPIINKQIHAKKPPPPHNKACFLSQHATMCWDKSGQITRKEHQVETGTSPTPHQHNKRPNTCKKTTTKNRNHIIRRGFVLGNKRTKPTEGKKFVFASFFFFFFFGGGGGGGGGTFFFLQDVCGSSKTISPYKTRCLYTGTGGTDMVHGLSLE